MAVKFIIKAWNLKDMTEYYISQAEEKFFLSQIGYAKKIDTYEEAQETIQAILDKWDFYILQIEKIFYNPA